MCTVAATLPEYGVCVSVLGFLFLFFCQGLIEFKYISPLNETLTLLNECAYSLVNKGND